jgi:hypothetical protein
MQSPGDRPTGGEHSDTLVQFRGQAELGACMITRRELVILTLLFLVSLPAVTTRIYASDEIQYFSWLRSVAFDHDANFDNEYRYFYDSGIAHNEGFRSTFLDKETLNENGRRPNNAPIGAALLWSPFYAVGHAWALATGATANGLSQPYIAAVAYGSAVYGFLAVLLSISIARRVVGRGFGAALVVCAATPLIFYMYVTPGFGHADDAFAVSLFLWIWLRVRGRWSPADVVLLGATGALMWMVREQDVLFVAAPLLDFARHAWRDSHSTARRKFVPRAALGAAAFLAAYVPQLIAYRVLNGHFGPSHIVTRKLTWWSPHAWGVLFSPKHGLFAWTPLALFGLAGLIWLASGRFRRDCSDCQWVGIVALILVALQIYIIGAFESWTLAGSFGQRRFVSITPLLTLGVAVLWPLARDAASRWRRVLPAAIAALCIWWNAGLILQYGGHRMDRDHLTLAANAWTTFVVLPREVPSIAWRYLTDRASFYGRPRQ